MIASPQPGCFTGSRLLLRRVRVRTFAVRDDVGRRPVAAAHTKAAFIMHRCLVLSNFRPPATWLAEAIYPDVMARISSHARLAGYFIIIFLSGHPVWYLLDLTAEARPIERPDPHGLGLSW